MSTTTTPEGARLELDNLRIALERALDEATKGCYTATGRPPLLDPRRRALVKTKIEEAMLWAGFELPEEVR